MGTISEYLNCTNKFEVKEPKLNHSQFLSSKNFKA